MTPLTRLQMEVLEFERARWKYAGTRATAIRERFHWSETRHSQVLNHILDQPGALTYDPQTVTRLRRLREARLAQRDARRRGFDAEVVR